MKIKIHSKDLQKKLDHLCKITKNKSVIPILKYIKMDVEDSVVKFTASDLEVTLIANVVPEEIIKTGSTCVLADKFTEVIKNIKDSLIELSIVERKVSNDVASDLIIKSKSGRFKIPCLDSEDFPLLQEPDNDNSVSIPSDIIVGGLNRTDFAMYRDLESRPNLCSVIFDFKTDKTVAFATDGFKVAANFSEPLATFPSSVRFPIKLSSVVKGLLSDASRDVVLSFDDKNIKLDLVDYLVYSKKAEGECPNYDPLLHMDTDVILSVSREEITDAIKRSLTFTDERYSLINMTVLIGRLSLAAENVAFGLSAEEEVFCENKQGSGFFKVNGRFFLEILQRTSSESIEISFSEATPLVYISPLDKTEDCLFGLMKYK